MKFKELSRTYFALALGLIGLVMIIAGIIIKQVPLWVCLIITGMVLFLICIFTAISEAQA